MKPLDQIQMFHLARQDARARPYRNYDLASASAVFRDHPHTGSRRGTQKEDEVREVA